MKAAPKVKSLTCFDISSAMLSEARRVLQPHSNTKFHLLQEPCFPSKFVATFDFVYAFDVLVHCDLHTVWQYLLEIKRILSKRGKAFLHFSNLSSKLGWERFIKQKSGTAGGFHWMTPDTARLMLSKAGYQILKESSADEQTRNIYYMRDFLVIVKPST